MVCSNRFSLSLPLLSLGTVWLLASCVEDHRAGPTLSVEASISAVTLGGDCGDGADADAPPIGAERCAADAECPGFCTQSGIRLALSSESEGAPVPFELLRVRMYTMDGELVDALDSRRPRVFSDDGYVDWDEMIQPGDEAAVSYDLSAPDWNEIGGGEAWTTYGMEFRIEADVRIDGVERTLEFQPASREPEVVT